MHRAESVVLRLCHCFRPFVLLWYAEPCSEYFKRPEYPRIYIYLSLSLSLSNQIDALIYVSDLRVKICGVTGGAPSTLATIIYFQSTAKTAWKMLFMIYKVSTCLLYIFIIWPSICVVSWKWHFYCVATGCMRAYFNLLSISGVLCQPIFLSPTSLPASPHFISCYGSHGRK